MQSVIALQLQWSCLATDLASKSLLLSARMLVADILLVSARRFRQLLMREPHLSQFPVPSSALSIVTIDLNLSVCSCTKYTQDLPGMSAFLCRPRSNAVIRTYEVVARIHSVVAIRESSDQIAIYKHTLIPAHVMCAQWIRE